MMKDSPISPSKSLKHGILEATAKVTFMHPHRENGSSDLSFVDIKELTTYDIVEINGEKWILSKRHKTKVNFQVKLLDSPLQIIKRYERFQEDKLVFPNLNYWNICKPLKKMIKECGISKDISFHIARHSISSFLLRINDLQNLNL